MRLSSEILYGIASKTASLKFSTLLPLIVIQALVPAELEKLFKECGKNNTLGVRNKAILSILLDCGLRVSELANLSIHDVNIDDGSLLIRRGKGNKQRIVHIGVKAQKALWKYITLYRKGKSDGLFLNRTGETLDVVT